jgi:hypothetical protein
VEKLRPSENIYEEVVSKCHSTEGNIYKSGRIGKTNCSRNKCVKKE